MEQRILIHILCYGIWSSIHGLSKQRLNLRSRDMFIFVLQTDRKNVMSRDVSVFDDCNLSNVKVYLNSEFYPNDDLNLNFGIKIRYPVWYVYVRFHKAYYGINSFLTCFHLLRKPFAVIDCSHQNESVKSITVDVRIKLSARRMCLSLCLLPHHTRSCNWVLRFPT